MAWEAEPSVEVRLTGDRLPFNYEPYAQVELVPDITIAYEGGDLSVSGNLNVPRGTIEIRELPAQAVSVSEDEVIVGAEEKEGGLRTLNMDVTVVVGEDEVSFSGFGVTGNLEGDTAYRQQPGYPRVPCSLLKAGMRPTVRSSTCAGPGWCLWGHCQNRTWTSRQCGVWTTWWPASASAAR